MKWEDAKLILNRLEKGSEKVVIQTESRSYVTVKVNAVENTKLLLIVDSYANKIFIDTQKIVSIRLL